MAEELIYAKNETNGVVGLVPREYLSHPVLGLNLREVRNGKVHGRLSEITGTATVDEAPTPADVAKIASKAETKDK